MVLYGVDLSHHKPNFDIARARREGYEFVLTKATDGASYVDPTFRGYMQAAQAAGVLFAAYHYQQAGVSVASQVDNVRRNVPTSVPVMIDVEANSGGVDISRRLVEGLRAAGYRVPMYYMPRWYWQSIGSPSMAGMGLPPLWSSRYPDYTVGTGSAIYSKIPASWWDGYGGLPVAMLQFTSSGAVANYSGGSIDLNAFRGTRDQLAALWGGTQTKTVQEDDMPSADEVAQVMLTKLVEFRTQDPDGAMRSLWDGKVQDRADLIELLTLVRAIASDGGVDTDAVRASVKAAFVEAVPDVVAAFKEAATDVLSDEQTEVVADKLAARLQGTAQ